jgi:hypothetical protein
VLLLSFVRTSSPTSSLNVDQMSMSPVTQYINCGFPTLRFKKLL